MNFQTKVTRKNTINRGLAPKSVSAQEWFDRKQESKENALLESAVNSDIQSQTVRESESRIVNARVAKKRLYNFYDRVYEQACDKAFQYIMTESYKDSLVLDDWAIKEYSASLESAVEEFITERGGFKLLKESAEKTQSRLLINMKSLVENVAKTVADRLMEDAKSNDNVETNRIDVSLKESDKEELDVGKSNLQLEEVADLIKGKVKDVVKEEKERSEEMKEVEEELTKDVSESDDEDDSDDDNEAVEESDDDDSDDDSDSGSDSVEESTDEDDDDESVEESFSVRRRGLMYHKEVRGVTESTLFNKMMQKTMKEAVQESINSASSNYHSLQDDDNDQYGEKPNYHYKEILDDEFDEESEKLDEEINSHDSYQSGQVNLDMILSEAVAQYTLYEMFHTLKIASMTAQDIKNF